MADFIMFIVKVTISEYLNLNKQNLKYINMY